MGRTSHAAVHQSSIYLLVLVLWDPRSSCSIFYSGTWKPGPPALIEWSSSFPPKCTMTSSSQPLGCLDAHFEKNNLQSRSNWTICSAKSTIRVWIHHTVESYPVDKWTVLPWLVDDSLGDSNSKTKVVSELAPQWETATNSSREGRESSEFWDLVLSSKTWGGQTWDVEK